MTEAANQPNLGRKETDTENQLQSTSKIRECSEKKKNRTENGMGQNESRTRAAEERREGTKQNRKRRGDGENPKTGRKSERK